MILKFSWIFWLLALCVSIVPVSVADPLINQREKESLLRRRQNEKYNASSAVLKMTSHIPLNGTLGWRQFSYLQKHPRNFDVMFAVGPEEIIVKAPIIFLTLASPVFEHEFEGRWENVVSEEVKEILLPDLDPEAFKLFVELTILDTWSVEALKALELPTNQLLHLMSICHKYGMTYALKNLTELAEDFLRDFGTHVNPEDFLLLSAAQLEAILASDELYLNEKEVFRYASSWAEEQCKKKAFEVNGANMRLVLGGSLYQVRFPVMSITDFATVIQRKGLLSAEEITEIVQFIATGKTNSYSNDTTELKFRVDKRKVNPFTYVPRGSETVSVAQVFSVVDTPFVCDGTVNRGQEFNINTTTTVRGVGFLGPIDADSHYDVTVQILKCYDGCTDVTQQMSKRIFAAKSKTFYFIFDQPVVLNPIPHDNWRKFYIFRFSLRGPNTRSLRYVPGGTNRIHDGNNKKEFVIKWWTFQLVEIVYTV